MSKIWLIGGAVSLAALLLASVVVGLTQREDEFPADTPEGTVQRFLSAVQEEDYKTAHGLFSQELRGICPIEDFAGANFRDEKNLMDSRVTHEETRDLNGTAVVIARVTRIRGDGPFGTSESSFEQRYTLAQEDAEWRFTNYPWPYFGCQGPFPDRPERLEAPAPVPAPVPIPEPRPAVPQQR